MRCHREVDGCEEAHESHDYSEGVVDGDCGVCELRTARVDADNEGHGQVDLVQKVVVAGPTEPVLLELSKSVESARACAQKDQRQDDLEEAVPYHENRNRARVGDDVKGLVADDCCLLTEGLVVEVENRAIYTVSRYDIKRDEIEDNAVEDDTVPRVV